jgi:hypothetical protein
MKTLAVVLIIVSIVGIALSVFPNLGFRNVVGGRSFPNNSQGNTTRQPYNPSSNPTNPQGFGFGMLSTYLRVGLWVVALIIGILMMREPKSAKK